MQQGSRVEVKWVKGHRGNEGNEATDALARSAHSSGLVPWKITDGEKGAGSTVVTLNGQTLEDGVRRVLKQQSITRNHYEWLQQQLREIYIRQWKDIDWRATLGIIHNNNHPGAFFTSQQDCNLRNHRIKKIHGMLPALEYMGKRKPALYFTNHCKVCRIEVESVEHLWKCTE